MPDILPSVALTLVVISITPTLVAVWKTPNPIVFVKGVTYCSLCRYLPSMQIACLQEMLDASEALRHIEIDLRLQLQRARRNSAWPALAD